VPYSCRVRSKITVTELGVPSSRAYFQESSLTAEDTDMVKTTRVTVGEGTARSQCQAPGLFQQPIPGATCAGFHTHAVGGHALQDPSGHPPGHQVQRVGGLRDRGQEDRVVAVVVPAEQSAHSHALEAGSPAMGRSVKLPSTWPRTRRSCPQPRQQVVTETGSQKR
jgi:hypothetical protein